MSSKTLHSRSFRRSALALALVSTLGLPAAIQAADVAAPAVSLTWSPNPEADLAGYKLHFGTSSGNYSTVLDVGRTASAPLPPMILGNTYYVALSAYDTEFREGPLSAELAVTASPPGPVAGTGFATGPAGLGSLQWKYPKVAAAPADRFAIQSSEDLATWSAAGETTPADAVGAELMSAFEVVAETA